MHVIGSGFLHSKVSLGYKSVSNHFYGEQGFSYFPPVPDNFCPLMKWNALSSHHELGCAKEGAMTYPEFLFS